MVEKERGVKTLRRWRGAVGANVEFRVKQMDNLLSFKIDVIEVYNSVYFLYLPSI